MIDLSKIERHLRNQKSKQFLADRRKQLMKTATRYEWKVYKALPEWMRRNAVRQRTFRYKGCVFFYDIYLPCAKAAIEVDGGYHKGQREYDALRDELSRLRGIKTFRITNEQVSNPVTLARFVHEVEAYCVVQKTLKGK